MGMLMAAVAFLGPLADRQIKMEAPVWGGPIVDRNECPEVFRYLLEKGPVAVLAPGHDHIGFGMAAGRTDIYTFRFNLRLRRVALELIQNGEAKLPPDFMWGQISMGGVVPNEGDVLEWALQALERMGCRPDCNYAWFRNWGDLIEHWRKTGKEYSPELEEEVLKIWREGLEPLPPHGSE